MSVFSTIGSHISALVHPDARSCAIERARHETFIAGRLASSVLIMAMAPIFLVTEGAPSGWEALTFFWLVLPLAGVAVASRTGNLIVAQAICIFAMIACASTVALTGLYPVFPAMVWLVLAPLEALLSLNFVLVVASSVLSSLAALTVYAVMREGMIRAQVDLTDASMISLIIPAIVYAGVLGWSGMRLTIMSRQMNEHGGERYRVLVEAIGDLVLQHDRSGAVTFASRNCEQLFGIAGRELTGRGFFERIHVGDRPAFLKLIADASQTNETVTVTLRLRTSSVASQIGAFDEPVFRWIEMRARHNDLTLDADASNRGWGQVISVVRDITALKNHEQEIEEARTTAERANIWKDRFLANVSHELRTPLNAIIGFSEMLGNESLAPKDPVKTREYANIINASGQHLLAVVNTILDMSKIEAGSFEIFPEPFAVRPLADLCCDMVKLKAEEGGIELVRDYSPNIDEILADKRACKQILINLLSNAVKFTPAKGRVTLTLRPEGNTLLLIVSDTGIGIQAPDLPKLGDPFFQARATYDRPYEGTGLGLSVVRGLVGLHGGSISIESGAGAGTAVTVRLPMDCRGASRFASSSAKIEVIPRNSRGTPNNASNSSEVVKKIA